MMIKIQKEDFDLEYEVNFIKSRYSHVGAVSSFIGYVRDTNQNKNVKSIDLEVYKKMATKTISIICESAEKKWDLIDTLVIHRYGKLLLSEKIVLVTTFAMHRKNSIEACSYIMDHLKKDAPFWKKEFYDKDFSWL